MGLQWVDKAKSKFGATGLLAVQQTLRHIFGQATGMGTMPHALIGYAGSTVKAARLFAAQFPEKPLTVLVDYFGRIDDARSCA